MEGVHCREQYKAVENCCSRRLDWYHTVTEWDSFCDNATIGPNLGDVNVYSECPPPPQKLPNC